MATKKLGPTTHFTYELIMNKASSLFGLFNNFVHVKLAIYTKICEKHMGLLTNAQNRFILRMKPW